MRHVPLERRVRGVLTHNLPPKLRCNWLTAKNAITNHATETRIPNLAPTQGFFPSLRAKYAFNVAKRMLANRINAKSNGSYSSTSKPVPGTFVGVEVCNSATIGMASSALPIRRLWTAPGKVTSNVGLTGGALAPG